MSLSEGISGKLYIDRKAKTLAAFYGRVYRQLSKEIKENAGTLWQQERAAVMLSRVDAAAAVLDQETRRFLEKDLPQTYFAFGTETKKRLRKMGEVIPKEFSSLHTDAVAALSKKTYVKFGDGIKGLKESATKYIKLSAQESLRAQIATGQLKGDTALQTAKAVNQALKDEGLVSLIDKSGKGWQMDVYAEMLTRTTLANAARDGTGNTAKEFGFDLVEVTSHNSKHAECAEWEGKILSLSGDTPGYPTLEDAEDAGLFHVNCEHNYFVVAG